MEHDSDKALLTENRDLMRKLREQSMRDVLKLSLKRGPLGSYKAEDVVAYSRTVLDQWTVCEKNYNDYIKGLYHQIDNLQAELLTKECTSQSAVEQRFNLLEEEVQAQIGELNHTISVLQAKLNNATAQLKSVCELYDAQKLELNALKSENQRLNESPSAPTEPSDAPQALSEADLNELLTGLENLQIQNTELRGTLDNLQTQKIELENKVQSLEDEKSNLESMLESAANAKSSSADQIADLTREKTELQIAFDALSINYDEQKVEIEALTAESVEQSVQYKTLSEENARLTALIEELRLHNVTLEEKQNTVQAQAQSLHEQNQVLSERNAELETMLAAEKSAAQPDLDAKDHTQLLTLTRGNKELIRTIKAMALQNQELSLQMSAIKESFQKVLRLESEKQIENEQLQQLLSIERTRIRQLVRESWKTSLWNEVNSMLM